MKLISFIPFLLGIFIFAIENADAACLIGCGTDRGQDSSWGLGSSEYCEILKYGSGHGTWSERVTVIGNVEVPRDTSDPPDDAFGNCQDPQGICWSSGGNGRFPTNSEAQLASPSDNGGFTNPLNGQTCRVHDQCSNLWCNAGPGDSNWKEFSGNWDASEQQCVVCTDTSGGRRSENKQFDKIGDTSTTYVGCDDNAPQDIPDTCESACGSDWQCDEQTPNVQFTAPQPDGRPARCDDFCKFIPETPPPGGSCSASGRVILHQDVGPGGACKGFDNSDNNLVDDGCSSCNNGDWNDDASAITIQSPYTVRLYENTGYGGGEVRILSTDNDLTNTDLNGNWNDKASSFTICGNGAKEGTEECDAGSSNVASCSSSGQCNTQCFICSNGGGPGLGPGPSCGNGVCESGETSSCPQDCGSQPPGSYCENRNDISGCGGSDSKVTSGLNAQQCYSQCNDYMDQFNINGCWILAGNGNCYCRSGGSASTGGSRPGGNCPAGSPPPPPPQPTCTARNPGASVSPGSQSGDPGQALSYTVSVTNNDIGDGCAARSFDVNVPNCNSGTSGWSCSSTTISVSPGSTASTPISVVSSSSSSPGTYQRTARASGGNTEGDGGFNYVVQDSIPPRASLTASPSCTDTDASVTLDASGTTDNLDSNPDFRFDWEGNGVWDTGWQAKSSGGAVKSHTYTTSGVYNPRVQARDDAGNIGTASITVSISPCSGSACVSVQSQQKDVYTPTNREAFYTVRVNNSDFCAPRNVLLHISNINDYKFGQYARYGSWTILFREGQLQGESLTVNVGANSQKDVALGILPPKAAAPSQDVGPYVLKIRAE